MAANSSVRFALIAAALFGASTPLAKLLLGHLSPALLAGLLYLGSGAGLLAFRLLRDRGWTPPGIAPGAWAGLIGATVFGGVLGPLALMYGLRHTSGATASLMLNLETVLTAALAWIVFREHADRRIVAGMLAIVAGGAVLSGEAAGGPATDWIGPVAVAAACLCWAIDNNLTRAVSASDPLFIALVKGGVAGTVNTGLALLLDASAPAPTTVAAAMLLGLVGYGVSLVLFVLALRGLGTARTGAYFATAPFIGAALAIALLGERPSTGFWVAAGSMALGVWLHLSERHEHAHTHEPLAHRHTHVHDEHHRHAHAAGQGPAPHEHWHVHGPLRHKHPHFPDLHHRHRH
jgi:drug/metabolite transporter (DMT)-like permease